MQGSTIGVEYIWLVQSRPKLGAWRGDLDRLLLDNETKPARERLTLIRIDFRGAARARLQGSYDAGRRYAKSGVSNAGRRRGSLCAAELCAGPSYSLPGQAQHNITGVKDWTPIEGQTSAPIDSPA
jgi:hypothetical protein